MYLSSPLKDVDMLVQHRSACTRQWAGHSLLHRPSFSCLRRLSPNQFQALSQDSVPEPSSANDKQSAASTSNSAIANKQRPKQQKRAVAKTLSTIDGVLIVKADDSDTEHRQPDQLGAPLLLEPASEQQEPKKKKQSASSNGAHKAHKAEGAWPYSGPMKTITRPLPYVLFLHTGGTLGMDPEEAFEESADHNLRAKHGVLASQTYRGSLRPGEMLSSLLTMVPELARFANVELEVLFNKDSSRVGPADWIAVARALHENRQRYDAFIVVHGTDTMSYTAAALSLMLQGFKKPIILTGSQLPLRSPRTDARQNLLDAMQCATSASTPPHIALHEVAVCFGGRLMRGNRTQKVNSSSYQAFDSPTYPHLATLGIDVDWNTRYLLRAEGTYKPRFKLDPRVIRIPIVPGMDPRQAYGDLYGRGVRGVVLEAFGVGNLPDRASFGWLPWLRDQTGKGLQVYLASQCAAGPLHPALYEAGQLAARLGVEAGPHMTPECAAVKLMFCLKHPDLALGVPLAGEL